MKDRSRQRANRRIKQEMIDLKNHVGFHDPTPYKAVKGMVEQERKRTANKKGAA